jgi:hypothetical protein
LRGDDEEMRGDDEEMRGDDEEIPEMTRRFAG